MANAGPDQSATVGQVVRFDGSGSHDPDNDPIIVYKWKFGDGTAGRGVNPTHTYLSPSPPGGYVAKLVVRDSVSTIFPDTVRITGLRAGDPGSFLDTFDRDDSDSLGGPSQTDPQWTEAAGNLVIKNQRIENGLRGDNIGTLAALTGANQSASGDFISSDNNASPRLGVLLRVQDARNHYRLYRISGGSSQLRISKLVNGAETILKSVQVPVATVNMPFHLAASVAGTTLTLTMGTVQISVTDTTYASGSIGLLVNTGPAATHAANNFCAGIGAMACP